MRSTLSILLFCLIQLMLFAQPEEYKGFFGVSLGAAIPVAEFASTSPETENSGYANTGFSGFLSANILLHNQIGFAGLIGYSRNPYNVSSFKDDFISNYPDVEYEFTADPYGMFNILGGAFVSIPQGRLDINLKGYIGVSIASMPATRSDAYSGEEEDPRITVESGSASNSAFTYGGGVNLMFHINKKMALLLDVHYLQAKPEFNAVELRLYRDGQLTELTGRDFEQKFQVVVVAVGIAFTFTR